MEDKANVDMKLTSEKDLIGRIMWAKHRLVPVDPMIQVKQAQSAAIEVVSQVNKTSQSNARQVQIIEPTPLLKKTPKDDDKEEKAKKKVTINDEP